MSPTRCSLWPTRSTTGWRGRRSLARPDSPADLSRARAGGRNGNRRAGHSSFRQPPARGLNVPAQEERGMKRFALALILVLTAASALAAERHSGRVVAVDP